MWVLQAQALARHLKMSSKTMVIQLTPQQLASLKKFLERTDLKGYEVPEYLELVRAVNTSTEEKNQVAAT